MGPFQSAQLHDFNPGDLNEPGQPNYFLNGGVFWTKPVAKNSVTVLPGRGDAHFELAEVSMFDYFNLVNALFRNNVPAPPIEALASVDVRWTGTGERLQVENPAADFGGQYENARATLEWAATNAAGYTFSTVNSSETNIAHAFTAHVHSGAFHP